MRCGDCKHYAPPEDSADAWGGKCARLLHGNGTRDGKCRGNFIGEAANRDAYGFGVDELDAELLRLADTEKAAVVDGSGYHAALRVKPDFGCVLFEAKK